MECPAFLCGLKWAGQRSGGRIHSQGGDMYHMYDADIALPVVGEEKEHGRVRTGRAVQVSSVHGLFKQRKMVGILLRDVMARGREAVRSGGDVAPEEGQISGSGNEGSTGVTWTVLFSSQTLEEN